MMMMTTMRRRLTLGLRTSADSHQPRKLGRLPALVVFISDDFANRWTISLTI